MSFTCGGPPEPHSFNALKDIRSKVNCRGTRHLQYSSGTALSVFTSTRFFSLHFQATAHFYSLYYNTALQMHVHCCFLTTRWQHCCGFNGAYCMCLSIAWAQRDEKFVFDFKHVHLYLIALWDTFEHIWTGWCWFQLILLNCRYSTNTEPEDFELFRVPWGLYNKINFK